MKIKLSRTNQTVIIFFLVTLVILSIATVYVAVNVGKPAQGGQYGLHISAQQLLEKPATYLALTNVDSYVQEAISKPSQDVYVGDWGSTQIDDMISANNTSNIEFNNNYYSISLLSADPASSIPFNTVIFLTQGWTLWIVAAIITAIIVIIRKKLVD